MSANRRYLAKTVENRLLHSNAVWQSYWTKASVTVMSDDIIYFRGVGVPLLKAMAIDSNGTHYIDHTHTTSVDNTSYFTRRVVLGRGSSRYARIITHGWSDWNIATARFEVDFDNIDIASTYVNSGVSQSYSISQIDSYWVEVTQSVLFYTGSNTGAFIRVQMVTDSGTANFSGDLTDFRIAYQQLVEGAEIGPYTITKSDYYWGPHDALAIMAEPDYGRTDFPVDMKAKLYTGRTDVLRYNTRQKFKVPVKYVSSAFAASVNTWWYEGDFLSYHEDFEAYTVAITNEKEPVSELAGIYDNQFSGVIELEVH